jgi:hypothetical protein
MYGEIDSCYSYIQQDNLTKFLLFNNDRNHYDPYAPGTEQGANPHRPPFFPGDPEAILQLTASTSSATSGIVLSLGFS